MGKRKYSGLAQAFGLLGCIFFAGFSVVMLVSISAPWVFIALLSVMMLLLDAIALRFLFEADDSLLGRFFFRIGDDSIGWLVHIFEKTLKRIMDEYGKASRDDPEEKDK